MEKIPEEWGKRPTDEELRLCYEINFRWVKSELAWRLNQYIEDGDEFEMDEADFDDLAHEMDEHIDCFGTEYLGDWLYEELQRRGYGEEEA